MFVTYGIGIAVFWIAGLALWQGMYKPSKGGK